MMVATAAQWIEALITDCETSGSPPRDQMMREIQRIIALQALPDGRVELDLTALAMLYKVPVGHVEKLINNMNMQGWLLPTGLALISRFQVTVPPPREPTPDLPPAPPRPLRKKPSASEKTALYRWYDDSDVLIYVGITNRVRSRATAHIRSSVWNEFAHHSSVDWLPDRDTAEAAERAAIIDEHPVFNIQYNNTPAAYDRLVAYLTSKGRLDLVDEARAAFLKARTESAAGQGDLLAELGNA